MGADHTRLVVNLTLKSVQAMHSAAQYEELRRTDIVNRAIQLYDALKEADQIIIRQGKKSYKVEWK